MLKEYLLENVEDLIRLVNEINSYSGALEYLIVYENDEEFFNLFFQNNPIEAVRAALYGNYNYNDEYVKFNGYDNLESLEQWEYEELVKSHVDEVIKEFQNYKEYIIAAY